MSTTYLSIHDLLRITYTYEMQAMETQAQAQHQLRSRSDSACSVSYRPIRLLRHDREAHVLTDKSQMPEICAHLSPPSPRLSSAFANLEDLETDFTNSFIQKKASV